MADGLTIGQAAAFVGVTIKTVRHYHRLGLVKEPERDSSGYRRYRSADLLRLAQARTLAGAGVPLAEIGDLLDADPEQFAATLNDVHRRLTEQIEDLIARRDTLDRLAHGDRALLPDRACAVLDRLTALGFSPDYVATQREAMVLARALIPAIFDSFLTQLEHSLDDSELIELIKRGIEARSWDPDDPRIEELASALADKLLSNRAALEMPTTPGNQSDTAARYGLVNHHGEDQEPSIARLNALVEARLRAAGITIPYQ
ncbi:Transcriptional regulator, MerR family [[Actinomadura] parvosata subsp. kistnae]|uniref:MerR family transcriptional regulator n=1 Tax=[Actinomadura] parvosata subsp. kistnae TaxID=1909395 RepID=A0A1V0A7C7_9ACTN|nr:MerR family transcriptional regulator [Nonomuraea sp. ATCC 55076]AQZ66093.1 MerR family transcriptional regulator [Nonomuraea sp. ATCC 55076]SPL97581.1 Transcriptional regulator, MerR family [Actinomadura parvosata subsp. kistnae]